MQALIKAVIFDMDGVLIDSEPLWERAMVKGFRQFAMPVSDEDCRSTMGRRINEVVDLWVKHHKVTKFTSAEIELAIIDNLIEMIETEGKAIEGIPALLKFCKDAKLKIGLATSSSERLMNTVLKKLQFANYFDAKISAEHLKYGKPHPEVFLVCAEKIAVEPSECIVIEDSVNGAISAKAAQMQLIVVPDPGIKHPEKFVIADHVLPNMHEVLTLFKSLVK
ncbi:MAG: hexitol phosphatase HxpB [Bacteroidetes bacterium]|nr:hexitol phosphatase HxpB [Bacteroidota bacterium]